MIAMLAVLLPGLASAAQLSLAPVRLGPTAMVPAMTLAPLAAPALMSPSLTLAPISLAASPTVAPAPTATVPAVQPEIGIVSRDSTPEELAFVSKAALELAVLAEDWGAERGLKASRMTGKDFLSMLDAGLARYEERHQAQAPSPRAYAAARVVQAQAVRMVKALLKTEEPLYPQVRRILSVWNVFNQEMEAAAAKGSASAIEEEARLFASQVERSV
ncbi:MAG: hypothetical protein HY926_15100 [Elusimicrobia bacterium]|nr:hypothetical protein [Elusimicrobiota bacterium]